MNIEKFINSTIIKEPAVKISESSAYDPIHGDDSDIEFKIKREFINPPSFAMKENDNLIWVSMKAIPIYKLTNNIRAKSAFTTGIDPLKSREGIARKLDAESYRFKFLSSMEIMEQLSHSWDAYDSWAAILSQSFSEYAIKLPEQAKGMISGYGLNNLPEFFKGMVNGASDMWSKMDLSNIGTTVKELAGKGLNLLSLGATGGYVANTRVDTPLQYKGSERRSWELMFQLINTEKYKNHENVVLPIKMLEMFSSPSFGVIPDAKANADIILPYLFEIRTEPGDLFYCDLAVLKSVQPTWRGPWIGGYPSRCEVRLSFMEYRPLEQRLFYNNPYTKHDKITVIQQERAIAYERAENAESNNSKINILPKNK